MTTKIMKKKVDYWWNLQLC